ncbi:hypothetical protein [Fimbriimonas ginsengisoli]|uniref:hypothetical protein n=1 Tax=Fimbriimonas ginsengisoli TaxID=1005039 RepID=UPI00118686BB|nr:hypothetical protein [Fimbriimonas ginsengisoli]
MTPREVSHLLERGDASVCVRFAVRRDGSPKTKSRVPRPLLRVLGVLAGLITIIWAPAADWQKMAVRFVQSTFYGEPAGRVFNNPDHLPSEMMGKLAVVPRESTPRAESNEN